MKYLLVLFLVALAASEIIEITSTEQLKAAIEDPDNIWFIKLSVIQISIHFQPITHLFTQLWSKLWIL